MQIQPRQIFGSSIPRSVRAAATANVVVTYTATSGASGRGQITAAPASLDGITFLAGDRFLLPFQTAGAQNGIWKATTPGTGANGVWDRDIDFDDDLDAKSAVEVLVTAGTLYANTAWLLASYQPTVGGASGSAQVWTLANGPTNGGTGLTSAILGNIPCGSGANTMAMIAPNTAATRQVLTMTGTGTVGAVAVWATLGMSDLPPTMGGAGSLVSIASAVATGVDPYSVACDPSGRYVYVVNLGDNTVSMFSVGAAGALTSIGTAITTGVSPRVIACDPSGRYVYVANTNGNSVSMYSIGSTGSLTSIAAAVATGTGAYGVACDPSGRYVYITNYGANTVSMFSIGATGALTSIAAAVATGTGPGTVACDPSGRYAYVVNAGANTISMFAIGATGVLTSIGTAVATGTSPYGVSCDPSGRYVYAANNGSVSMFSIGTTGALTSIGAAVATGSNSAIVACDPSGRYVYVANYNASTISIFSIGSTGALMSMGSVTTGSNPYGIACDPTGKYVYAPGFNANTVSMFSIQNVDSIQAIPAARILSDRITPATPSKCMQIGSGPSNYTITALSGTPSIISGLLSTSSGLILISCSNGDQAIIGLGVGSTVGYCAVTWNSAGGSLAVTTPTTGRWAVDYVAGAGWRINNQVGAAGVSLGYACLLLGGI